MPPTCDSRKGFTFLSQLKFFWELLTGWAVQKWYASIQSLPTYIHTYIQTGRHKCIQTYKNTDWEGIQSYYQLTFATPSFCRSSVFIYARPRFIGGSWISIGDAGVRPKEMRVLMVFALNKTPWFKGNKNGVISAEMSMHTLDIWYMLYFHALHTHVIAYSGPVVFDGTRFPPRCLQVRHQIQIWKMHWSEMPSKMEGQKCWKETNSKVVIYSDHLRSCRHDIINGSFHMKWWNTTAMTGIFKFSKAEYERTLSIWGT